MPRRQPTIRIVPEVLAWARESAGLSQDDLRRRITSGEVDLDQWESSSSVILVTASQLENIADAVKRPTATLLLNAPPKEPPLPRDFRRPSKRPGRYSPDLVRAIRHARRLQRVSAEVLRALEEPLESDFSAEFSSTDHPDSVASWVRDLLGIQVDIHERWSNEHAALRGWRSLVEGRNILVLSADFPREEAQGFSLVDAEPSVIMLSAKDPPTARCFTLWHEFGHLLLSNDGLCLTDEPTGPEPGDDLMVEDWCNRFAEAMVMDGLMLNSRDQTAVIMSRRTGYEEALKSLANYFKVSQHVVLFRMRHLELLSESTFWEEFHRVKEEQSRSERERRESMRSGPNREIRRNVPREVVRNIGQRLARSLLQAFDRGLITHADLADYFGARLKHIDNIRREAHRSEVHT